ncbi:MAG: PHP-associated domain-containing protein [Dehalococcoidia bacterium]
MNLDLHTHSVSSDDSKATVEQFAKWTLFLRNEGFPLDGFVLTEHRKFDYQNDYSDISERFGVLILKGSEVETDHGHFLVFGVTEKLTDRINFARVDISASELVYTAQNCEAIAIPAHPGRFGIGLCEFNNEELNSQIRVVESLNWGNLHQEQVRSDQFIQSKCFDSFIGGSDSHVVSTLGKCLTKFEASIQSESDLVRELTHGSFQSLKIEDIANH